MADGPNFIAFHKASDWERGIGYNVIITDSGMALTQTEKYAVSQMFELADLIGPSEVMDMALGDGNKMFLLDEQAAVWSVDTDSGLVEPLLASNHGLFGSASNMTVSGDLLIVADPHADHRLMAITISSGQIVWVRSELLYQQPLLVLAITVDARKHIHLLTPHEASEEGGEWTVSEGMPYRLIELDPYGDLVHIHTLHEWVVDRPTSLAQLYNRFQLAVTEGGNTFIADRGERKLFQLRPPDLARMIPPDVEDIPLSSVAVGPDDIVYAGDTRTGGGRDDGRFLLRLDPDGRLVEQLTSYIGHADLMRLDATNRLVVLNRKDAQITLLSKVKRTKAFESTGRQHGFYYSTAIDSHISELVWHKLALQANFEGDTHLIVRYYASDSKKAIVDGAYVDLDDYITDPNIPFLIKQVALKPLWSKPLLNPREALLHRAQGQYLWLFFEFSGTDTGTPDVFSMRVYYPRTSYLNYLPAVYQEEEQSKDFLERYFSLFATFLEGMDERIDRVVQVFDIDAVSGPYLKWLATWLGIASQEHWSEEQLRSLMRAAPAIYRQKGTRASLEKLIAIYTGEAPIIIEPFQIQHLKEKQEFASIVPLLYGDNPYCFNVLVKQEHAESEKQRIVLQKILDEHKPAYTEARLIVLQPWVYMDYHSYLGVNTFLSEPRLFVLDERSSLPHHTIIIDVERDNRMDIHTRLELDSELE
ncbi:phage tail protein [Paenibacillus koleovorans]|uniref:phage tail protein n=1 Tax=Paenibacillus koleovorans TaxID=121608 RepID=UPI000FD9C1F6|nr:phage tail protein [Paenibacillus koleovorans]